MPFETEIQTGIDSYPEFRFLEGSNPKVREVHHFFLLKECLNYVPRTPQDRPVQVGDGVGIGVSVGVDVGIGVGVGVGVVTL